MDTPWRAATRWLLAAGAALLTAHAHAAVVDRIAAVVNDEVIALSEVYDIGGSFIEQTCAGMAGDGCVRDAELEVLDSLILRTLIHQELRELGLDVTGTEVDRTIDQMMQDYGVSDRAAFRKEVERSGLTWEAYREQVITEQLRQLKFNENVIRPRISLSDDELLDLYNRTVRGVDGPVERELAAISFMPTADTPADALPALADDIVAKLRSGELAWTDALTEHNAGVIGGADGNMGSYAKGDLAAALDAAVFAVGIGDYTDPIGLPGGVIVIIRVVGETEADVKKFDDVKDELRNRLYEQKVEAETERWYQQARRRAAVRVLLEAA